MNRASSLVLTTLLLLPLAAANPSGAGRLRAQEPPPLLDGARRDLLHEALSGEIAKDHVIAITRHHRIQGSRGYRDAATYVLRELQRYGYAEGEAWIESFPADGRVRYQTWQSPSGWDIERAELRLVEPGDELIVAFPEIAMSLMTYSNPGDVTAELVWVGPGTRDADYDGRDVEGKYVLATGYGGDVHRLAVLERGAAGVVAYLDDERAQEHPDMLQYTGLWPRTGELDRVAFGFNLTRRQGERLRSMLEAGQRVVLRGTVEGVGLEPFFMDVVVARIAGTDRAEEEIVFSAHLDHPKESANDNASGSAALLDIARALAYLIDSGRIPRPRRTLRFLWVPEWYGTMAYLDAHPEMAGPELSGSWLANLNLDMVGEHLELIHSRFVVTRTPASLPSALPDVVEGMADMVGRMDVRTPRGSRSAFHYRVAAYSGGSDHMQFIDRKVPAVMLSHSPDYTHHTSEDTPDKVDPVELERTEIIAAATALFLSDLSSAEAVDLVHHVGARSLARLAEASRAARARMLAAARDGAADAAWSEAANAVRHAADRERRTVASVLRYRETAEVRAAVQSFHRGLAGLETAAAVSLAAEAGAAGVPAVRPEGIEDVRVPARLTRGPLDFGLPASQWPSAGRPWYEAPGSPLTGDVRFELVNFVDGRRTVSEIRDALSAEYGPVPLEAVARYLDDLVRVGVVEWTEGMH